MPYIRVHKYTYAYTCRAARKMLGGCGSVSWLKMSACIGVCMSVYAYVCMYTCVFTHVYAFFVRCMKVLAHSMCVCMCVFIYVCMYVCMYVGTVCAYV
jgi:hypothetical protein